MKRDSWVEILVSTGKPIVRTMLGRAVAGHVRAHVARLVKGANGLEIGGPSTTFRRGGCLPIYPYAANVDNCNFASTTIWEGKITAGRNFVFDARKPPGTQYISEATSLEGLDDKIYDFVLSSHTIEHTANPLRALREWVRVLRRDGVVVLLVPHRDHTFDHRRPVTALQHLIDDERAGKQEDDLTHLEEILSLHDLERDPLAGTSSQFRQRSERNFENRCLHHHVFDTALVAQAANELRLQILHLVPVRPHHIVLVAQKKGQSIDNSHFLKSSSVYAHSPFVTDRSRWTAADRA